MEEMKTYSLPIKTMTFEEGPKNSQFLKTKFFAIAEGDNLNMSSFELSGIKKCLETQDYANKPILGAWDSSAVAKDNIGDFGAHDFDVAFDDYGREYNVYLGDKNERPLGLILPNSAKIEEYKGKQWLTFEGLIWVKYNPEAVALLRKRRTNNVSVEIDVLDYFVDERKYDIIKSFTLLGITVIGVEPGIANANLVLDYTATPQYSQFVATFSKKVNEVKESEKTMEFLKKDDIGTGGSLQLALTKEDSSDDRWGAISKTKLMNDLLRAKNYKTIIPKAYLVVQEGWEDSPSEKLGYPVVQIKDGKVVYNTKGIASASAYLMKEKNEEYFVAAKAKLNRIRKLLGMEKLMSLCFGVETNEGWGEVVSQEQPKTIKMGKEEIAEMDKKEIVSKMASLFAERDELEKKKIEMATICEESIADFAEAEEADKEDAKKESDLAKEAFVSVSKELAEKELELLELSRASMEIDNQEDDEDDDQDDGDANAGKETAEEEIDSEEEEYPIDTVGHDRYAKCMKEGCAYVSNSKSYVVYERDGKLFASNYAIENDEIKIAEEEFECEKLYAVFVTGGTITKDDAKELPPVMVEVTKGIHKKYDTAKLQEIELKTAKEYAENYKKEVNDLLAKFDDLTEGERLTKDFREEIISKIFDGSLGTSDSLEMFVKAKLYDAKQAKCLGGSFVRTTNNTTKTESFNDNVQDYLKNKYAN